MLTYLTLNLIFIAIVSAMLRRYLSVTMGKPWRMTLAILLILTLVFDNLMIGLGFFWYSADKLLGIYLLKAPV